jgi:hypothetical protein
MNKVIPIALAAIAAAAATGCTQGAKASTDTAKI